MSNLEAVIFDMDGVIVNTEPLHYKASKINYDELGITISDKEYESFIGLSNKDTWMRLKKKHNLHEDVDDLIKKQNAAIIELFKKEEMEAIPGIKKLLKELSGKGIKIALASSSPVKYIEFVLNYTDLEAYFSKKVSGESMERGKPYPDIFLDTAEKINIKPHNVLVIEDSCNGVTAAKKAGMKCIAYSNPDSGKQDLNQADLIVDSINEINIDLMKSLF